MTVTYKREMNRNYMVIKPEAAGIGKYAEKMLSENQISGLLSFHEKKLDDQTWFYYDITSRQPLKRIMDVRTLNGKEIRQLFSNILFTLKQMERFFLDEGQLNLKPEYIYVEPDSFQCFLCLIPGRYQNFAEEFCEFAKYLLDHVCHTDTEAVVLAFGIFQESRKENFGIENMERLLKQNQVKLDTGPENFRRDGQEREEEVPSSMLLYSEIYSQPSNVGEEQNQFGPASKRQGGGTGAGSGENKICQSKILKTAVTAVLILIMTAFPAGLAVLKGSTVLLRYKWIIAVTELFLGLLVMAVRSYQKEHEAEITEPEPRNRNMAEEFKTETRQLLKENDRKSICGQENRVEDWETLLRQDEWGTEKEDTELQTVLLTDMPERKDCRRLVPVIGGEEILISYFPFIIGKNKELSDFCLEDSAVSRLHLRIDKNEDIYMVTDLNSTNGTYVGGRRLDANESCELEAGEILEIAGHSFRFI